MTNIFPIKQDLTFHVCMKCQILFSGKNITNLSSAELAQSMVKVMLHILSKGLLSEHEVPSLNPAAAEVSF